MRYTLLILCALSAGAQTLSLSGVVTARPGETVPITAVLSGSAGDITGLQGTFTSTVPLTFASAQPSKTSLCAATVPVSPTSIRCGLFGLTPAATVDGGKVVLDPSPLFNVTPIPDGSAVAVVSLTIPASAVSGSTITVTAENVSANGASFFAMQGGSITITVIDLKTAAALAFNVWFHDMSDKNFIALELAIAAAQK